jgi:hypothetical protein
MVSNPNKNSDILVRAFPDKRVRTGFFIVISLILLTIIIGLLSRFGTTTKLKPGKGNGHGDPPPGTDKMDMMVTEMKKELDKTFWVFCYGAESRCVVYKKWLQLLDGEFKAMAEHFEKTHGQSLRTAIEATVCNGDCDSNSSRAEMLDRLSRVYA